MGTANPLNVRKIKANVCLNPTDLSAAFPHGGTALGFTGKHIFYPNVLSRELTREEYGGSVDEVAYLAERAILALVMRDFDVDHLAAAFPNTATVNGHTVIRGGFATGQEQPGYSLTSLAAKVLLSPEDVDAHEGVLLFNAVPVIDEDLAATYSITSEQGLALSWVALPDGTGRTFEFGKLAGMTL